MSCGQIALRELGVPIERYYAYRELTGWTGDKVTRFRVTKHRDAEPNALEITEELLTNNIKL